MVDPDRDYLSALNRTSRTATDVGCSLIDVYFEIEIWVSFFGFLKPECS